jgi:pectin methylesterase-like acyl-CoA thioesterase
VLAASLGYIVASGRASNEAGYYVLDHCSIAAKSGVTVPKGAYYLGRPWGDYARVAVQDTTFGILVMRILIMLLLASLGILGMELRVRGSLRQS